jgi:hypothetical protein
MAASFVWQIIHIGGNFFQGFLRKRLQDRSDGLFQPLLRCHRLASFMAGFLNLDPTL